MPATRDVTQLKVWQKALKLAKEIHCLTKTFPRDELFGATSQMRRASMSVAANIAEGFERVTSPDKKHKYIQARSELTELITFLYHAQQIAYISPQQLQHLLPLAKEVQRMTNSLIMRLR